MSEQSEPALLDKGLVEVPIPSGFGLQRALRVYYSHKLGNLFFASFFQIFIAKILTPENYATYAILLAIIMAAERFLSFGIDRTVMRFVPSLTSHGNFSALRWLFARIALVRSLSLVAMVLAIFLAAPSIEPLLPVPLSSSTILAIAFWYVSYSLLADADAIGQSWMAHLDIATAATIEILARCVAISIVAAFGYSIDANFVITISALTSAVALLGLITRLAAFRRRIRELSAASNLYKYPPVDVREAPMFSIAAYASTIGWLTTSPAVIRIVAKGGLDVLAFASFSFIQALCISLQRGFPGLLILPSLEPVMAKLDAATQRDRIFAILSFVFKIELIGVLALIVLMSIAGADLIALLSRVAYSSYYYVMLALLVVLVLQTIYRICEIVMSIRLEHRLFIALWPLSLISIGTLYFTVSRWGLLSVLLVPIGEGILRIVIIFITYRRAEIWRALDPLRSFQVTLSASIVLLTALAVRGWSGAPISDIAAAAVSLVVFLVSLFIVRPFRDLEADNFASMLPASLNVMKRFIRTLARA